MITINYKITLLSVLYSLFSILCIGQDYEWQWAKNGGGNLRMQHEDSGSQINNNNNNGLTLEHIEDIVTDEDNNYYFLGQISHGNSHVDGNEVTTFGSPTVGSRNILITSFTCEGTYRWSRVIGGGMVTSSRSSSKMVLDNEGGVYVSVSLFGNTTGADNQPFICFGEDNCLPYYLTGDLIQEEEGRKSAFLLKYDTDNGDLVWRKDYQGNVNYYSSGNRVFDLQIDNDNVLHTIIGLGEGIHLDGTLTVELEEDENLKYYLVKFNTTGNLIGTPLLLPLEGIPVTDNTSFRYNESLNRYYLSGWVYASSNNTNYSVSFNGVTFGETDSSSNSYAYLLSFNPNDLQDWWYREFTGTGSSQITNIAIDSNSDIYIGGRYYLGSSNSASFGDYTFTNLVSGNRPYILKMNSDGEVQWSKTPSGYIDPVAATGSYFAYDVAINGNEVALATHGRSTVWDNFSINRPSGHGNDPYLIRFNKQTGEVIGLHDIYGSGGNHGLTAVTADQDGNYVVGGAMRNSLFTNNPNGIPTLYNISDGSYTDFFMARLAATPCGTNVSTEVFKEQTLKLYPNPTSGLVYIEAQDLQSYEVYNLLGQRLLSGTSEVINLQDLSKGTYIVKVTTQSGEVMTSKVIKQ